VKNHAFSCTGELPTELKTLKESDEAAGAWPKVGACLLKRTRAFNLYGPGRWPRQSPRCVRDLPARPTAVIGGRYLVHVRHHQGQGATPYAEPTRWAITPSRTVRSSKTGKAFRREQAEAPSYSQGVTGQTLVEALRARTHGCGDPPPRWPPALASTYSEKAAAKAEYFEASGIAEQHCVDDGRPAWTTAGLKPSVAIYRHLLQRGLRTQLDSHDGASRKALPLSPSAARIAPWHALAADGPHPPGSSTTSAICAPPQLHGRWPQG